MSNNFIIQELLESNLTKENILDKIELLECKIELQEIYNKNDKEALRLCDETGRYDNSWILMENMAYRIEMIQYFKEQLEVLKHLKK